MLLLNGFSIYAGIVTGTNLLEVGFQLYPPQNRIWGAANRALHNFSPLVLSYSCYCEWLTGYESLFAKVGTALVAATPSLAPGVFTIQHGVAWISDSPAHCNVVRVWNAIYLSGLVWVGEEISVPLGILAISSCAIAIIAHLSPRRASR